jgi:acetyltransferase-like isoleucine patch superfamily enzyme
VSGAGERAAATVYAALKAARYRTLTFALRAELRSKGATIHPTAVLGTFHFIGDPALLRIGERAVVNDRVVLNAVAALVIGDDASISNHAQIHTGYLRPEGRPREHGYGAVTIGDNAWIAAGAIVSAGVTVGANAIVGAGSVVTRDVEPDVFVGGVPARLIRRLDG